MKEHNNKRRWWRKYKDIVFSAIVSAAIGYLIGFYLDGFVNLKPTLENIENKTLALSDSIVKYRDEAGVSINYVKYNSVDGTICKIGINDNVHDHFVAVPAENGHGLKQGEKIYLINVNESDFCIYTKIAFVQIVNNSPRSSADFFINKKMLRRLNIGEDKFSEGVFTIHYKQEK